VTLEIVFTVMAASLLDPITMLGYVAAGALLRNAWAAIGAGVAWAGAMIALVAHLNPGYSMPVPHVAGRLLGGVLVTGLVFLLASLIRAKLREQ
jgi:uncharacterized membrane protein